MSAPVDADRVAAWRAAHAASVLVDRGACGRLLLTGRHRQDLLHRISTNDIRSLRPGGGIPSILVTNKGRILDRLIVLCRDQDLLLLTSEGSGEAVGAAIRRYVVVEDVKIADLGGETALSGLYGPRAAEVLAAAVSPGEAEMPGEDYTHRPERIDGVSVTVIRVPWAEGLGFLVVSPSAEADTVRRGVLRAGAPLGLLEADPHVFEALRIEAGLPARGRELSEDWNPLEMGQVDAISFTKGCYVGQEVIARLRTYDRLKRRLVRLEIEGTDEIPPWAKMTGSAGEGTVTSAAPVPGEARTVALAVVDRAEQSSRDEVTIMTPAGPRRGRLLGLTPSDREPAPKAAALPSMARGRFRG